MYITTALFSAQTCLFIALSGRGLHHIHYIGGTAYEGIGEKCYTCIMDCMCTNA